MKLFNWLIFLVLGLIAVSAAVYGVHYVIFRDAHHIFIYLLGDIAFVPIEVLLVTLIIHRLLSSREKRSMLKKMNMVIGAFFNEVGTELLDFLTKFLITPDNLMEKLDVDNTWTVSRFNNFKKSINTDICKINSRLANMEEMKSFLMLHRDFLLRLLENPNLLEHDTFTDLLWAVFHLTDEITHRSQVTNLTENDFQHLSGDMERAYILLVSEWLDYMYHLKRDYPYLFSLAVRTNPFNPEAEVEIP